MNTVRPRARTPRWRSVLPVAWACVLAVLMLGPALGHGYVLSYDMVWVPDLALRPDFLGVGSGLPRAVPSDAVVAVLDELVPGMLLQKLVLLGALVTGGAGAARLCGSRSATASLVAVSLYLWNPFVAERLLIGHWPVLLAYAALPWLADAARRWRVGGRVPWTLPLLLLLGSLSASAGLVCAVVVLAFAMTRDLRRWAWGLGLVLAANAPWVVSGLLHGGDALTDPAGAQVFALRGEGLLPAPLAALGLGGIWNSEVVPGSQTGVLGVVHLVVLLALAGLGLRPWVAAAGRRTVVTFAGCAAAGWVAAVLGWALPVVVAWTAAHVPGGGLLRDSARVLVLAAPFLAVAAAYGAARLVRSLAPSARPGLLLALVLVPVALMPDAALGLGGRLRAVPYPEEYAAARSALAAASQDARGDVLVLPLTSYRAPAWNHGHKVLDPLGRYLPLDAVASDELTVSGVRVAGEDPRVRGVERALLAPDPRRRAIGLDRLGIGFVVTDRTAGPAPRVSGTVLHDGPLLSLRRLPDARGARVPWSWWVAMTLAWAAYVALVVGALVARVRPGSRTVPRRVSEDSRE